MARSHLTLAALATSAVPGMDVAGTRSFSFDGQGDYDSALLTTRAGDEFIIRVPASQDAETEQGSDLVALRALTTGVRARLPFSVPEFVGQAPVGGTRAVVYNYIPGGKVAIDDVQPGDGLATSIGRSIAAIHSLPTGFVGEAGLPVQSASEAHDAVVTLIDNAATTGELPSALRQRWRDAAGDNELWRFQPSVINGALSADSFIVEGESVVCVLGWSALRVGDPAHDLHWMLGMHPDAAESAIATYALARGSASDAQVLFRATLYAELEIARWLLHGRELHDQTIVDDAIRMLDGLVDRVHGDAIDPLSPATGPIMAVTDIEAMLEESPVNRLGDGELSTGLTPVEDDDRDSEPGDDAR